MPCRTCPHLSHTRSHNIRSIMYKYSQLLVQATTCKIKPSTGRHQDSSPISAVIIFLPVLRPHPILPNGCSCVIARLVCAILPRTSGGVQRAASPCSNTGCPRRPSIVAGVACAIIRGSPSLPANETIPLN